MVKPLPDELTDYQVGLVLSAARPLPIQDRDAFLDDVAAELAACPELGDGVVSRTCRELQRKYYDPPDLRHNAERSRWR
jgi:hypothetical protein